MDWVKARIQIQDILLYLTLFYFTGFHLVEMMNWMIPFSRERMTLFKT